MDRTMLLALVLAGAVVLVALMALGWRNRQRRQADFARPMSPPAETGVELGTFAAHYVATTIADEPMNRVAVHGLGFRGRATVAASQNGLLLSIVGVQPLWIDRASIRGIRRATWAIDRAVETNGLHRVAWTLGDRDVDSYLRMDDPTAFDATANKITERQNS